MINKNAIIRRRINNRILSVQIITACMSFISMFMIGKTAVESFISEIKTKQVSLSDSYTIADNIDIVCMLQEENWKGLNLDERLEVLQVIANIEKTYLGINSRLEVGAEILDNNIRGQYTDSTGKTTINLEYLSSCSAHQALTTLCHEAYHAYQHRLIDAYNSIDDSNKKLLLFDRVINYKNEIADNKGSSDFKEYYFKSMEIDARNYADRAVCDYYKRIDEYINKVNSGSKGT